MQLGRGSFLEETSNEESTSETSNVKCCVKLDANGNMMGGTVKQKACKIDDAQISMPRPMCMQLGRGSFLEETSNEESTSETSNVKCCVKLDANGNMIGGTVKQKACKIDDAQISMPRPMCLNLGRGSFLE